jgi:hypothetical protein
MPPQLSPRETALRGLGAGGFDVIGRHGPSLWDWETYIIPLLALIHALIPGVFRVLSGRSFSGDGAMEQAIVWLHIVLSTLLVPTRVLCIELVRLLPLALLPWLCSFRGCCCR